MVAEWRAIHGRAALGQGCVVLTGGGSQLAGLGSYSADRLGVPVRVGLPTAETGAQSNLRLAGYAMALGLASAAATGQVGSVASHTPVVFGSRYLGSVGDWLRQNF